MSTPMQSTDSTPRSARTGELTVPESLSSTASKLIYLYLSRVQEATVDELCEALDIKRLSAYPVLSSLVDSGYIVQQSATYRFADGGA